jgi:hypothetical protein
MIAALGRRGPGAGNGFWLVNNREEPEEVEVPV